MWWNEGPQNKKKMKFHTERGPSPLIPSLMVMGFVVLIYWSTLMDMLDTMLTLFSRLIVVLLVIFLFLLIHYLSVYFSIGKSSSSCSFNNLFMQRSVSSYDHDGAGFGLGFGYFLFFLLFILLYNLLWTSLSLSLLQL